jgi:3-dehydroquinate synthase
MSPVVRASTDSAAYDIEIAPGLLDRCGERLGALVEPRNVAVITDTTVAGIYGERVATSLEDAGFAPRLLTIPAGEESKSWETAGRVLEELAAVGLDRTDVVLALGGGVVGDLSGFCAGVYMRGVRFVQVPTTLLAQVDSSVGGKTAVDLVAGKNLAGAFVQPLLVLADTSVLVTLPEGEWRSGLAEVAKSAILDGEAFLSWLEFSARAVTAREPDAVTEAVRASVAFKARVVEGDERETGPRESLNLGHTLGHALERVLGYGTLPHGVAVAEGLRFAARLAERVLGVEPGFRERQDRLLDAMGLPALVGDFDTDAIRLSMSLDKKARGGVPRFVLATAPGEYVVTQIDSDVLAEELESWRRTAAGRG